MHLILLKYIYMHTIYYEMRSGVCKQIWVITHGAFITLQPCPCTWQFPCVKIANGRVWFEVGGAITRSMCAPA